MLHVQMTLFIKILIDICKGFMIMKMKIKEFKQDQRNLQTPHMLVALLMVLENDKQRMLDVRMRASEQG